MTYFADPTKDKFMQWVDYILQQLNSSSDDHVRLASLVALANLGEEG